MAPAQGRPRLLVVDDIEDNRTILTRRFTRLGYDVAEADGGRAALGLINSEAYDAVLLDIMMPEIDGLEVLRQVRETYSEERLPVIMVSAKSASEDIVEALLMGANDYITKPVDMAIAQARISVQVERKRRDESLRQERAGLEAAFAAVQEVVNGLGSGAATESGAGRARSGGDLSRMLYVGSVLTAVCESNDLQGTVGGLRCAMAAIEDHADGAERLDATGRRLKVVSNFIECPSQQSLRDLLGEARHEAELIETKDLDTFFETAAAADLVLMDLGEDAKTRLERIRRFRAAETGAPGRVIIGWVAGAGDAGRAAEKAGVDLQVDATITAPLLLTVFANRLAAAGAGFLAAA